MCQLVLHKSVYQKHIIEILQNCFSYLTRKHNIVHTEFIIANYGIVQLVRVTLDFSNFHVTR